MKIALAITGASGAIYARQMLDALNQLLELGALSEVSLVYSDTAHFVWQQELGSPDFSKYPFRVWEKNDFLAPFASGSSDYTGLIICPCSMGTLGRIAGGISNDLTTRAADVMLKERRRLVCVVRETPYNLIHLRNMTAVTEAGGIICPATPSFYSRPQTMADAIDTVVHRALQLCGVNVDVLHTYRWGAGQK